jgi:zinc transport system ATP-binding protein
LASTDPAAVAAPALRLRDVTVHLDGATPLDAVSADVPAGGFTSVVGPNGAGKTTLLLALLGQRPFQGSVEISPAPARRRLRIGYVPQRLALDRGMPLTVEELLVLGRQRRPVWLGLDPSARERARALLGAVAATHLRERPIGALSGGELQRVLLALALGEEPELLVLDEPAAGLDLHGEALFCEVLERLRVERGFTLLMVTHDLGLALHHATHVVLLNRRVVAQGPPRAVLTPEHLARAYGLHMGGLEPDGATDLHRGARRG